MKILREAISLLTLVAVRTLSDAIDVVNATFTIGMLAHEMNGGQGQLSVAAL